jgi:hypothetical protein
VERAKGLSDRLPAHAQLLSDIGLNDVLTGLKDARNDQLHESVLHLVGQGFRPRNRSEVAKGWVIREIQSHFLLLLTSASFA